MQQSFPARLPAQCICATFSHHHHHHSSCRFVGSVIKKHEKTARFLPRTCMWFGKKESSCNSSGSWYVSSICQCYSSCTPSMKERTTTIYTVRSTAVGLLSMAGCAWEKGLTAAHHEMVVCKESETFATPRCTMLLRFANQ